MSGSGTALARAFHDEVVGPLLARSRPGLRYAAGRLGSGSDVLGLDDETSRDHDWGCRLTLLVDGSDADVLPDLDGVLTSELPAEFAGRPVRFAFSGSQHVRHHVQLATVGDFVRAHAGVDATRELSTVDWLVLTGQGCSLVSLIQCSPRSTYRPAVSRSGSTTSRCCRTPVAGPASPPSTGRGLLADRAHPLMRASAARTGRRSIRDARSASPRQNRLKMRHPGGVRRAAWQ
jgi:hypothetical protein